MDKNLSSPVHSIPVDDITLALIGRITVIWSGIDSQVSILLQSLAGFSLEEYNHLFGAKTINPKLETLKVLKSRLDADKSDKLCKACDAVTQCNARRNVMTHGQWGWKADHKHKQFIPSAYSKQKDSYLLESQLKELHENISEASYLICEIYDLIVLGSHTHNKNRIGVFAFNPNDAFGWPQRIIR